MSDWLATVPDSKNLITGGHNLWGKDYLQQNPVNDLSIEISGPVANNATKYANTIWHFTCTHKGILSNLVSTYHDGQITSSCPDSIVTTQTITPPTDANTIPVLAMTVAKLNDNVLHADADQSELARVYAFNNAKSSIIISQQALFTKGIDFPKKILHPLTTKDGTVMQALANALSNRVSVSIVTSTLGGSGYNANVDLKYIWNYLKNLLETDHGFTQSQAQQCLLAQLHLGTISYNGKTTNDKSHDKVWIIDDHIFYIGSHNLYPSSLQQFGVIIDNPRATAIVEQQLWDPLWKNSQKFKA